MAHRSRTSIAGKYEVQNVRKVQNPSARVVRTNGRSEPEAGRRYPCYRQLIKSEDRGGKNDHHHHQLTFACRNNEVRVGNKEVDVQRAKKVDSVRLTSEIPKTKPKVRDASTNLIAAISPRFPSAACRESERNGPHGLYACVVPEHVVEMV
ncbi:hypothetical protein Trydic_g7837 [Trypoxylus dichotomus]